MFTAVCGALVFRVSRDMSGGLKVVNLTTFSDMGELLYNGEIYAFALLGILMGMLGAGFVHATASLVMLVRCSSGRCAARTMRVLATRYLPLAT
jgi:hypothetical protein